jgi:hypothetical protein
MAAPPSACIHGHEADGPQVLVNRMAENLTDILVCGIKATPTGPRLLRSANPGIDSILTAR